MIVIGVIGAPAGGKSTVARCLRDLGATWVNADRLAHRCLASPAVIRQVTTFFGAEILTSDGQIDRRRLAQRVFGDDAESLRALHYLESLVHPLARQMTMRRLTRAARCGIPVGVLDAPLLLEADWGVLCDFIWCVDAPADLRRVWVAQRGWDADELQRREQRQWPIEEKRRLSTHVLVNDQTRESLRLLVTHLWSEIRAAARRIMAPELITPVSHCLRPAEETFFITQAKN